MKSERARSRLINHDKYMYALGGTCWDPAVTRGRIERLDVKTDTWEVVANEALPVK